MAARFRGTLAVAEIGAEYTLAEFPDMDGDYMVVGIIDVSEMAEGDVIELSLYAAVDGANRRLVYRDTYATPSPEEVVYVRPFISPRDGRVKITLRQVSGEPKSFPYWLAGYVLSEELGPLIVKLLARTIV